MSNKHQALIVIALLFGLGLLWFLKQDSAVNQLNATLQADPALQAYPYAFHTLKIENGVATLTTPRSLEVSVLQFLKIAQPHLDTSNPDSPEMIEKRVEKAQYEMSFAPQFDLIIVNDKLDLAVEQAADAISTFISE